MEAMYEHIFLHNLPKLFSTSNYWEFEVKQTKKYKTFTGSKNGLNATYSLTTG